MKKSYVIISLVSIFMLFIAATSIAVSSKTEVSPAPNGISLPDGYRN